MSISSGLITINPSLSPGRARGSGLSCSRHPQTLPREGSGTLRDAGPPKNLLWGGDGTGTERAPSPPGLLFSPSPARVRQQPQAAGQRLRPGCAGNSPRFPQRGRGLRPSPHGPRGRTGERGKKRRAGREGRGGLGKLRAYLRAPRGPRVGSAGAAAGSRPRCRPGPASGKRRRRGGRAATIEWGPRHRAPAARSARAPG